MAPEAPAEPGGPAASATEAGVETAESPTELGPADMVVPAEILAMVTVETEVLADTTPAQSHLLAMAVTVGTVVTAVRRAMVAVVEAVGCRAAQVAATDSRESVTARIQVS